jgi:hypothetical protein
VTRRHLYQFIAQLLPEATPRSLLRSCATAMRMLRDLSAPHDPFAARLLDSEAFAAVLHHDDALGHIYQAINAPALEGAYRAARRDRRKFTEDDIPAVTQLFTPRWVVEFLLHNTLGAFWLETHPDSRVNLPWLVERPRERRPMRLAREITVLDPACGTMNFGLVAVELLDAMYREELDHAGRIGWPAEPSVTSVDQVGPSIARHNLFGIDIDPLALELAAWTIEMKLGTPPLHLQRADALFDACPGRFCVIATNPPYLSARNMPKSLVQRLKQTYPASWRDACACFIERATDLLDDGGRAGILAMQSFMFTGSFETLRAKLDQSVAVESIAHFGGGLFDVGNPGTLQTAAVVLRREASERARREQDVVALRLTDVDDKEDGLRARRGVHRIKQDDMGKCARRAWTYWLTPQLRSVFTTCPALADVAPPRQGLATTDNARFVRFWWEVDCVGATRGKWKPYAKGGRFRRWHESPRHRVDWADDGAAIKRSIVERYPYLRGKWAWVAKNASYYGRAGVTYSYLTSGRFSARRLDEGAIFDVAGSALFPDDPLTILGVLNSSTARALLGAINPTVNFQVGDLAQLPVPRAGNEELRPLVRRAIDTQRALDAFDETSPDFVAPMPWAAADEIWHGTVRRLRDLEARIDDVVAGMYGLDPAPTAPPAPDGFDRTELARRWVGFTLRDLLARSDEPYARVDAELARRVRDRLDEGIDAALGGVERFLLREFVTWHATLYERRPVVWALGSDRGAFLVAHERASASIVRAMLREVGGTIPDCWDRFVDDGIAVNLAPLRPWVRDRRLRAWLEGVGRDLDGGRFAWSETAGARARARFSRSATPRARGGAARPPRRSARACRGARPIGT